MQEKFVINASPHIKAKENVSHIMWSVVVALLPATIAGIYFFGKNALLIVLVSITTSVLTEYSIQKLTKRKITIKDGSAVITGLLLALILPPTVPLWLPFIGSFFAIAIVKQAFGGLGYNIFNPALAGRSFLVASWPYLMSLYVWPKPYDALTAASPLSLFKEEGYSAIASFFGSTSEMYKSLFMGNIAGSIGETSAMLLLAGATFLFIKKIIDWRIPVAYIGSMALLALIFRQDILFHLLSGGLFIGAFFMATDYTTTPITKHGKLIFGLGCGLLTMVIRVYGSYPEGVMFSILLMNALTPLIDRYTTPRVFGWRKTRKNS